MRVVQISHDTHLNYTKKSSLTSVYFLRVLYLTLWKFEIFSSAKILREINFSDSKTTISKNLNFQFDTIVLWYPKSKLISRKIWLVENFSTQFVS